jgi:hypothetical protein
MVLAGAQREPGSAPALRQTTEQSEVDIWKLTHREAEWALAVQAHAWALIRPWNLIQI